MTKQTYRKTVNVKGKEEYETLLKEIDEKGGKVIKKANYGIGSTVVYEIEE